MPTPLPSPFLGETVAVLQAAGLTLSENIYRRDSRVPRHTHEAMFFTLTVSGSYAEAHRRDEIHYGPASASFHPAGDEHSLQVHHRHAVCFNVEPDTRWLSCVQSLGQRLVRSDSGPLLWLMVRLREASRSPFVSHPTIENLMLEMLGAVAPIGAPAERRAEPHWLRSVDDIIAAEYADGPGVFEIAGRIGVHPVHLSRTFRRFRGCSIPRKIHRLRIDAACRRMADADLSLADLAQEVGFTDQPHFSHVFRTITGTTPGRFRSSLAFSRDAQASPRSLRA